MFKRIYVDNYRCFVNFDLPLNEITLLLGRNGTGKTSLLDVIFALRELLCGKAKISDPNIFSNRTLTAWQTNGNQVLEVDVAVHNDLLRYRIEIDHDHSKGQARISKEVLSSENGQPLFLFGNGDVHLFRDDHSRGSEYSADWTESALAMVAPRDRNTRLTAFLDFIRSVVVCDLYPANFEHETARHDLMLARDARNFASWYRHLKLEQPGRVESLRSTLKQEIDGFDGIRLPKVDMNTRAFVMDFQAFGKKFSLGLDQVSDGQRALTALYAIVHLSAGLRYTLFLDAPENYLALAEIQPWLMDLSEMCGCDIPQAVICSHHPELIDFLGHAHGVSLSRDVSGAAKWSRVSEADPIGGSPLKLSELVARGWEQ